jgi:hypothetical protein
MPATWIFQANPNRFNLDGFFASKPVTMAFLVTRYAERMAVGDQVYLWRAVGGGDEATSGVIAEAEVGSPVSDRIDDAASRPFWEDQNEAGIVAPRVQLRLIRTAQKREILQRRWLIEDPVLRDLTILKMANATNYEVSTEHAMRLNALWTRTGQDWTYAESLAGPLDISFDVWWTSFAAGGIASCSNFTAFGSRGPRLLQQGHELSPR